MMVDSDWCIAEKNGCWPTTGLAEEEETRP